MSTIQDVREYAGSTFPLAAPAPVTDLVDPVAVGLADFIAWWLNKDLNPWLAQNANSRHSASAVPNGSKYGNDPASYWVRNPKPALYIWYQSHREEEYTLVLRQRIATYGIFYVGDEEVGPDGAPSYGGIAAVASRSISNACDAQRHDAYGYNGDPNGTPIWKSLGIRGWRVARMESGQMAPRPNVSNATGGPSEGGIVRFYPALQGTLTVWETIGKPIPRDPQDVNGDVSANIRTNEQGDLDNVVDFMTRYVPGPDGSEQP